MRIELSIPQDFLDCLSSIGGIFYGEIKYRHIKAICTDSRECRHGDLFFAIDGKNFNGNDYIDEAISNGAIPVGNSVKSYGIKVDSGNTALLNFSAYYKTKLPSLIKTIAITGSVGKTTTKEFLKKIIERRYKTHATRENLNNEIGLAFTILSSPIDTQMLICEMGMNHMGEIGKLSRAIKPNIAIITKIGTAHIGNLGSIEGITKAKLEIAEGLSGILFIPHKEELLTNKYENTKTFSSKDADASTAVIKNDFGLLEIYHIRKLLCILKYRFDGNHLYECLSAAVAIAIELKISMEDIKMGILSISEECFRHKKIKSPYGFDILDDSYNASKESVIAAVELVSHLDGYLQKNVLLGDILELGEHSKKIHEEIGKKIAKYDMDNIFLIGEYSDYVKHGAISDGFPKERIFTNRDIHSPEITTIQILSYVKSKAILLCKASRNVKLERIINLILKNDYERI